MPNQQENIKTKKAGLQNPKHRLIRASKLARLGFWDWSTETNQLYWSPEIYEIFGQDPNTYQVSVENFEGLIHPDDLPTYQAARKLALLEQHDAEVDYRIKLSDGSIRYIHEIAEIIYDDQREITHIAGILQDNTAHKNVEKELRYNERRFKLALENIPDVLVIYNAKLEIQYINASTHHLTGRPISDYIGKRDQEIWPSEVYQAYLPTLEEAVQTGIKKSVTCRLDLSKNNTRNLIITCIPLLNSQGQVYEIIGITQDITNQVSTEELLKSNEAQLREVINSMEKAIAIYEAIDNGNDFVFVDMNIYGERITHYKIEEVLGKRITELFPGEASIGLIEKLKETWLTGHSTQIPLKQYVDDRITQWVENYIFKLPSGRVVAMFEDTLEKRAAELALLESEERYSNLFNQMMDGYAVHEMIFDENNRPLDYRFVSINPMFEKMIGLDSSIIGKTVLEVLPATEPYWIETYGKVVQTGEPVEFENYSKEVGKWFAVVAYRSDENCFVTIFSDITDRKNAEAALQRANSELEDRVSERTRELQILVNSMAGREVRMAELKKAIKKLRLQIREAGMDPVADDPMKEGLL